MQVEYTGGKPAYDKNGRLLNVIFHTCPYCGTKRSVREFHERHVAELCDKRPEAKP